MTTAKSNVKSKAPAKAAAKTVKAPKAKSAGSAKEAEADNAAATPAENAHDTVKALHALVDSHTASVASVRSTIGPHPDADLCNEILADSTLMEFFSSIGFDFSSYVPGNEPAI